MKKIYKNSLLVFLFICIYLCKGIIFKILSNVNTNNDLLVVEINELKGINRDLREQLFISNKNDGYLVNKALFRDLYGLKEGIIYNDNKLIKKGMYVTNDNNLVGIINHVDKNVSYYDLINKNPQIPVNINNNLGIICKYDYQNNIYKICNIDNSSNIRINDIVYTIPTELNPLIYEVGYISEIINTSSIEKTIYMKSYIDLYNNRYVAIYTGLS